MTWKKDQNNRWKRLCQTCFGKGEEELWEFGASCCHSNANMHKIDHPANGRTSCMGHRLERCEKCGAVWLVYHETSDDSIDIPAPVHVGYRIPDDDWRPKE